MTRLRRLEEGQERMDARDVDPVALEAALGHLAQVNRWLGARRALLRHLDWGLGDAGTRILDVGTGSADLPTAILAWARRRGRAVQVTAVEPHGATLDVARRRTAGLRRIRLLRADGLALPFADGAFDLALLTTALHHMNGPAAEAILRELARVARGGRVLIGELERSVPNYLGARLLAATLWRANPVSRHDGPVSVLRSFTPEELVGLARRAGLRDPRAHRHAFYRLALRAEA